MSKELEKLALDGIAFQTVKDVLARHNIKSTLELMDALRVLDILTDHLSICKPMDVAEGREVDFEVFDLDLWGTGKQKGEFTIVKEWLENRKK